MWSGAVFTAVVRSGTNSIHGQAFEFLRNTSLNAKNYFASSNTPYHQNQCGVNVGGPILRNRLFWFGSYQRLRISQEAIISSVPLTGDERQGLITSSTPVKDPQTGLPFSTNASGQYVIPSGRIDPVAQYLLTNFIPVAPPGGGTVFTTSASTNNSDQGVAKIDYNLAKSDQLNGMFFYERVVPLNAFPTGPYAGYGSYTASGPQYDLAIAETHTFSPRLINEARFGYSSQQETRSELNGTSPEKMGINGWDYDYWYQNDPMTPMVSPAVSVVGRFAMGDAGLNNWIEGGANWQASDFVTFAKGTVEEIRRNAGAGEFCRADVSSSEEVQHYVAKTVDQFGRVDAFFNNAGVEGAVAKLTEYADNEFDRVIGVNLRGAFLGLKYVVKEMIRQQSGCIVSSSSVSGLRGAAGHCAYVASKHAIIGLTKVAAAEVGKLSIRVNAICPGPIETRMMRSIIESSSPGNMAEILSRNPSGRFGSADEVAQLVLYLSSDESSYIHGAVIPIDGGRTAV